MTNSRKPSLIAVSIWAAFAFLIGCSQPPQEKYAHYLQRGKSLLESKDPSRAILEFNNAIREQPNEAEAYYWEILSHYSSSAT
jgi:Tfp pilus assembly protein PilF